MKYKAIYQTNAIETIEIDAEDMDEARDIAEQKYANEELKMNKDDSDDNIDITIGRIYEDNESFETSEGATGFIEPMDKTVNLTPFFDVMEDVLWNAFKQYAECAGIIFDEDSDIDFAIAKEISESILNIIQRDFGRDLP